MPGSWRTWGAGRTGDPVALLDVGTTKICCLIVAPSPPARSTGGVASAAPARLLGAGYRSSSGVKAGSVIDLAACEQAIRATIDDAEAAAGLSIESAAVVNASSSLRSVNFVGRTSPVAEIVDAGDISRIIEAGRDFATRDGRQLLHMHRVGTELDGVESAEAPLGRAARELALELNAVTVAAAPYRNLLLTLDGCYISAESVVAAPFASALATLDASEAEAGTTVIDFGGGTTSWAVFAGGRFIQAGAVAIGGEGLTNDLARALGMPFDEAERIKVLYGNLLGATSNDRDSDIVQMTGEDGLAKLGTSRAQIRELLRAGVDEIVRRIGERQGECGLDGFLHHRVVVTGGGSQLAGLSDYLSQHFGAAVRLGNPRSLRDAPVAFGAPQFAASFGLLPAIEDYDLHGKSIPVSRPGSVRRQIGEVGRWFMGSLRNGEHSSAKRR